MPLPLQEIWAAFTGHLTYNAGAATRSARARGEVARATIRTSGAIQFISRGFGAFPVCEVPKRSQRAKGDAVTEILAGPGDGRKTGGGAGGKDDRIWRSEAKESGRETTARRWLAD